MERQLSVINESVVELSTSQIDRKSISSEGVQEEDKIKNNKISEGAEENYNFLLNFHKDYENSKQSHSETEPQNKETNEKNSCKDPKKIFNSFNTIHNYRNSLSSKLSFKSLQKRNRKLSLDIVSNKEEPKNKNSDSPSKAKLQNLEKNLRRFTHKTIMEKLNFKGENSIKEKQSSTPDHKMKRKSLINDEFYFDSEKNFEGMKLPENTKLSKKLSNFKDAEVFKKVDRSNTFCFKPEKKNLELLKTKMTKKKTLTMDQIVEDINKNVITFSKRRPTIKENLVNNLVPLKNGSLIADSKFSSFKKLSTIQIFHRKANKESTLKLTPYFIKKRAEINFKRLLSGVNVITLWLYIKKEIIRYGTKPTKFKPLLEQDHQTLIKSESLNISNYEMFKKLKSFEEQMKKTKFPWYIILPESIFRKVWEKIFLFVLIYFVTFVPYRISFTDSFFNVEQIGYFYFDIIIEGIFLLDIIFNCLISFYDHDGNIVISAKTIIYIYFTSLWLILDILCFFPFFYSTIIFLINKEVEKTIILVQYLRSIKLYLIVNSTTFVQSMEDKLMIHNGFIKLFVFLINTIFACHMFSCLFYYCSIINKFDENTWVYRNFWLDQDKLSLYLRSLYFAFTSYITVGYGDIVAFTTIEIVFVLCWLLFSGVFYTSSLTSLSKIFLDYSSNKFLIYNKCMIVSEIFKKSKLPQNVEQDTIKFLKTSYSKNKEKISVKSIKSLLSEIPMNLRYQIANEMYDGALYKIEILNKASKSFVSNIVPLFQSMYVLPNNYVYHCDEVPQKIYFICEGSIKLQTEDFISFITFNEGNYFGEIEILRKTYRESNAKAIEKCCLLTLNKNIIWDDIMKNHVEFLQFLIENMIKRHNFNERMRDIIEVLIEEGQKLFSENETEYKKTFSKFSNIKKNFFFLSLVHNIENGKNKSQLSKLNELLSRSLNDEESQNEIESNSQVEVELNEFYQRKERRRFTNLINKEQKQKTRKSGRNFFFKDHIARSSSKSLRSRINNSIDKKERKMSLIKMFEDIKDVNSKIFDRLKLLDNKIESSRIENKNIFCELEENIESLMNNRRVPKKVIEKLKEVNTQTVRKYQDYKG